MIVDAGFTYAPAYDATDEFRASLVNESPTGCSNAGAMCCAKDSVPRFTNALAMRLVSGPATAFKPAASGTLYE